MTANNMNDAMLSRLITCFDTVLGEKFETELVGGGLEPIYLPKSMGRPKARIVFSHDYFSSALHELAHWCVAGDERRMQEDYGYWYEPDGRNSEQQRVFELVEVKPQATEWLLSKACGVKFRISADNLSANALPSFHFKKAIYEQVQLFCGGKLPKRTQILVEGLAECFLQSDVLSASQYRLEDLDN